MQLYVKKFIHYIPLLQNLIGRDIKVKYRRSVLGVIWSVLNPLLMMLVINAVFSTIFKFDIPNFPIYYLTGSILFGFYSEATNGAMISIVSSAGLIKKIYIPKYLFAVEKVLFAFVNLLFSLIAVVLVMIITKTAITVTIIFVPIVLIYVLIFSLGIGLILAVVATFFRDMVHFYGVALTALNFLTPIFYPIEIIPENMMWALNANPLVHFVNYFRQCVLYGTIPSLQDNIYCLGFSLGALIIGLIVFKRYQDKFFLYI